MNDVEKLRLYKESLKSAWGYNDYNDWPIKFNSVMHLFLEKFAQEILDDIREISEKQISSSMVAEAFINPARIYRLINPLLYGMKRLRYPISEQRRLACYFLDLVQLLKAGSPFNEEGRNCILDPIKVSQIVEQVNMRPSTQEEARRLQQFCGIMWAYTESIFFRAHDVTKEIHGPYVLNNGDQLLIRRYMNLRPTDMIKEIRLLECDEISIYTRYNPDLKLTIDSYNHLFLHDGNYISDLCSYAIECDGKKISLDELWEGVNQMCETIRQVHQWVSKADWQKLTLRYAEIYWYRKRPLKILLKKDEFIPQSVRDKIQSGLPDERRKSNLSESQIDRLIQMII